MKSILVVDTAGRVVLPKPLRQRHGLRAGSELRLRDDGGEIHLRPVSEAGPLEDKHGFLVYTGHAKESSSDALALERDARIRKLSGRRR